LQLDHYDIDYESIGFEGLKMLVILEMKFYIENELELIFHPNRELNDLPPPYSSQIAVSAHFQRLGFDHLIKSYPKDKIYLENSLF